MFELCDVLVDENGFATFKFMGGAETRFKLPGKFSIVDLGELPSYGIVSVRIGGMGTILAVSSKDEEFCFWPLE